MRLWRCCAASEFRCSSASVITPTATVAREYTIPQAELNRKVAPPNLIVFSRLADERLWAEVLNLGGFDVLMTPFEPEEVLRVDFAAWSRWEYDFAASTAEEPGGCRTRNSTRRLTEKERNLSHV